MKKIFLIIFLLTSTISYSQYIYKDAFPNLTFFKPTELTQAPDGTDRFFVASQTGQIRVFPNDPNTSSMKMFLDIPDSVTQSGFQGLYGLTFHPEYVNNGYFYVYYSAGPIPSIVNKLVRFQVSSTNPDSAFPGSAYEILSIPFPSSEHNGGTIKFGSDGYLYISLGDGSPGSGGDPLNHAQNRSEIYGKILRINVDSASGGKNYSIPPTNPYVGNMNNWLEEIYAYGFRNVWKFSFDFPTNTLWAGDVGQTRIEEVNLVNIGGNYGWRLKEGTLCYNPPTGCDTIPGLIDPYYEYNHSQGASVTGGYVYHGTKMPNLVNKYIYGDYMNGRVWALTFDTVNAPVNQLLFDSPHFISDFAIDTANNIYYAQYGFTGPPKIFKIVDTTLVGLVTESNSIPERFELFQNYPNPFNPLTTISFSLRESSYVTLNVYEVSGKLVSNLVNSNLTPGKYRYNFDASRLSSGVYFYRLIAGDFVSTKRGLLLK